MVKFVKSVNDVTSKKNIANVVKVKDEELTILLSKCQQGDSTAFERLYELTSAKLNGIAYRITRNTEMANEVLQEAFIEIWQHCRQYQSLQSKPYTWLISIVRYRAFDRLRYEKKRCQQDTILWEDEQSFAYCQQEVEQYSSLFLVDSKAQYKLHNCLAKLEKKQSESILMAYLYGYRRDEIATHFQLPINTIKSWLKRGLGRLQQCLNN